MQEMRNCLRRCLKMRQKCHPLFDNIFPEPPAKKFESLSKREVEELASERH